MLKKKMCMSFIVVMLCQLIYSPYSNSSEKKNITQKYITNVTAFSALQSGAIGRSVAFAENNDEKNDMEFQSYKRQLIHELYKFNFKEDNQKPDYIIKLMYDISGPNQEIEYINYYNGFGKLTRQEPRIVERYTRRVVCDFYIANFEKDEFIPVYNITGISKGTTSNLTRIYPYIIKSMFKSFPLNDGESYEDVIED